MIRLFVALALPDQCRQRLVTLGGGIDGARWVDLQDLHITLRFVGEVSEPMIDEIMQALAEIRVAPVEIALNGAGQFASKARVRAVWVGVEKNQGLLALHEKVDKALIRIGLSPERRKYTPHVTIGRMSGARPNHVQRWLEANGAFFAPPYKAHAFVLYESRLGRHGASYFQMAEFSFFKDRSRF